MSGVVRKLLKSHPFATNCIVYGALYVGAELSQQLITKRFMANPKQSIDFPTIGRFAVMGTFAYSPTLYTWYRWLDSAFPGTRKTIIVKKLMLDQFILTPILLTMFYAGMSLMEGEEYPLEELKHKFLPTFVRSCIFWIPAQTVNFLFVPPKLRIIFVGACAFVWVNIMCWVKRQKWRINEFIAPDLLEEIEEEQEQNEQDAIEQQMELEKEKAKEKDKKK